MSTLRDGYIDWDSGVIDVRLGIVGGAARDALQDTFRLFALCNDRLRAVDHPGALTHRDLAILREAAGALRIDARLSLADDVNSIADRIATLLETCDEAGGHND